MRKGKNAYYHNCRSVSTEWVLLKTTHQVGRVAALYVLWTLFLLAEYFCQLLDKVNCTQDYPATQCQFFHNNNFTSAPFLAIIERTPKGNLGTQKAIAIK